MIDWLIDWLIDWFIDWFIDSFLLIRIMIKTFKIQVDASIIGGMVVSIADKFCDMSMATKLNKYSDLLKAAA